MKKKILVLLVFTLLVIFTSCDDKTQKPHEHEWDDGSITVNATCTTKGNKEFKCKSCAETKLVEIEALGHNYVVDEENSKTATCKEDGKETKKCERCSDTITTVIPKNNEHNFDVGVETTPASCETNGTKTFTCQLCQTKKTEDIPATGHNYNDGVITTEATCSNTGIKTFTCLSCSETKTEDIPTTEHDMYRISYDAETCCTDGKRVMKCVNCSITKEEIIPANNLHDPKRRFLVEFPEQNTSGKISDMCFIGRKEVGSDVVKPLSEYKEMNPATTDPEEKAAYELMAIADGPIMQAESETSYSQNVLTLDLGNGKTAKGEYKDISKSFKHNGFDYGFSMVGTRYGIEESSAGVNIYNYLYEGKIVEISNNSKTTNFKFFMINDQTFYVEIGNVCFRYDSTV